jgi:hypothetical protein
VAFGTGVVIFSSTVALRSVYLDEIENNSQHSRGIGHRETMQGVPGCIARHATDSPKCEVRFNDSLTWTTHPNWAWVNGWYFGPVLRAGS